MFNIFFNAHRSLLEQYYLKVYMYNAWFIERGNIIRIFYIYIQVGILVSYVLKIIFSDTLLKNSVGYIICIIFSQKIPNQT